THFDSFPVAGWTQVHRASTESEPWGMDWPLKVPTRSAAVSAAGAAGAGAGAGAVATDESVTPASFFAHATSDAAPISKKVLRMDPPLTVVEGRPLRTSERARSMSYTRRCQGEQVSTSSSMLITRGPRDSPAVFRVRNMISRPIGIAALGHSVGLAPCLERWLGLRPNAAEPFGRFPRPMYIALLHR